MAIEVRPFDAAEYLTDEETQRAFLNEAIETDDAPFIARAIGVVARAKGGMSHLARLTGIKRQTLNKSLSENGNPTLETLLAVIKALGMRIHVVEAAEERELADA